MARLTIVTVLCLSFIGVAMIPKIAAASPKPSCCNRLSDCAQGIQKKSCCLANSETAPPSNLNSVNLLSPSASSQDHAQAIQLDIACDNKKSDDSDEPTDDESSLYLRHETFLI